MDILEEEELNDALDDLAVTYLMHLPTQEYTAEAQLFYAFEQAWWHYCDQHQRQSESLRGFKTLVQFVEAMIKRVPALRHLKPRLPAIAEQFRELKKGTPTYGAILMDRTLAKVLLVQQLNKAADGPWTFPRGKIERSDHEDTFSCAAREVRPLPAPHSAARLAAGRALVARLQVFEETSYDIRPLAVRDKQHYCERKVTVGAQRKVLGLYLVPGVDDAFPFAPRCEGEIQAYCWFHIDDLAKVGAGRGTTTAGAGGGRVRLFQVVPFLRPVLEFAKQRGDAAAKARATGGLKALRNPTRNASLSTAVSAAALAAATESMGDAADKPRQRKGQHAADSPGDGGAAPSTAGRGKAKKSAAVAAAATTAGMAGARGGDVGAAGLDDGGGGLGFERMLQMNAALHDAMPAYEGLAPQAGRAASRRGGVGRIELNLPAIAYDVSAAGSGGGAVLAAPGASTMAGGVCAQAWLDFRLDRAIVMAALKG